MKFIFLLLGVCIIFTSSCSNPEIADLNEGNKAASELLSYEEPIASVEEPEIPEEPIEPEEEVVTPEPVESVKEPIIPEEPIISEVEPSVSVEPEESSIVAEEPIEIIIPDIPPESFSNPKPSEEREHPDPSTFTDKFTIDYDSLPLSNVVLSEASLVDYVVNQDVIKLEDEHGWLTTTFVCKVEDAVFSTDFYIEIFKDGSWYRLPNKAFPEIAIFGQVGREEVEGLYLKEWYANLVPGNYRVVKQIFIPGADSAWYCDEFVIE